MIPVNAILDVNPAGNSHTIKAIRTWPRKYRNENKRACFPRGAMMTIAPIVASQMKHKSMKRCNCIIKKAGFCLSPPLQKFKK
jgi:hypothetical protein